MFDVVKPYLIAIVVLGIFGTGLTLVKRGRLVLGTGIILVFAAFILWAAFAAFY